jgi:hypothetical protein
VRREGKSLRRRRRRRRWRRRIFARSGILFQGANRPAPRASCDTCPPKQIISANKETGKTAESCCIVLPHSCRHTARAFAFAAQHEAAQPATLLASSFTPPPARRVLGCPLSYAMVSTAAARHRGAAPSPPGERAPAPATPNPHPSNPISSSVKRAAATSRASDSSPAPSSLHNEGPGGAARRHGTSNAAQPVRC